MVFIEVEHTLNDVGWVDSELLVVGAVCVGIEEDLEIIARVDDAITFGESTPDFPLKAGQWSKDLAPSQGMAVRAVRLNGGVLSVC